MRLDKGEGRGGGEKKMLDRSVNDIFKNDINKTCINTQSVWGGGGEGK